MRFTCVLLFFLIVQEAFAGGLVTGTATYRERIALPPDAVFEATLEDVSKADAPAEVIEQVRIASPGNPPIHFKIPYDSARIEANHVYSVRGRILRGERLIFVTDRVYPVLTRGHGSDVSMMMRGVGSGGAQPALVGERFVKGRPGEIRGAQFATVNLENTYWKLTHLGNDALIGGEKQREPHLVLSSQDRRVGGSGGCNRLTGTYELDGDKLVFSKMAATMMACPQGMDTEQAFLGALAEVKTWKIVGEHLELFDAAGNLLTRFEARSME